MKMSRMQALRQRLEGIWTDEAKEAHIGPLRADLWSSVEDPSHAHPLPR